MSVQEILSLAKQGHPIAINTLLTYISQSRHLTIRVQERDRTLHVLLEAEELPDQAAAMEFVQDSLNELQPAAIDRVTVYGRRQGDRSPAWQQSFQPAWLSAITSVSSDHQLAEFQAADARSESSAIVVSPPSPPIELLDSSHPPQLMAHSSDTPDILKRPEAVVFLIVVTLVVFWDAYLSLLDEESQLPPTALSTSQLARRLQTSKSTVRRRKRLHDFGEWSRSRDPDGIAWIYRRGLYLPEAIA